MKTKQCKKCGKRKSTASFGYQKRMKDKLSPYCKSCHAIAAKKWRLKNPEKFNRHQRLARLRYAGGPKLHPDELQALYEKNGGVCAICGRTEAQEQNERHRSLCIDHSHRSGKVRDLLCNRCNRAIALMSEDISIILRAAAYLRLHEDVIC